MRQVVLDAKVMVVVEISKMSESLKKAYNLLEVIQKGLNAVSHLFFHSLIPIPIPIPTQSNNHALFPCLFFSAVSGKETIVFPTFLLPVK